MGPVINYSQNIIQGGADLVVTPVSNGVNATYGDWTGIPLVKRSNVSFNIRYTNISHVLNSDASITVTFDVVVSTFTRTVVNSDIPLTTNVRASIAGEQFWNFTEAVTTPSTHTGVTRTKSVTVPPLGTSWQAGVHFYNDMTVADDEFDSGMRIYNPNPPDYRPGQIRISSAWQSHNRGAGKADKRVGGSWQTMRTQSGPGGTGNPPSIRRSGSWFNQSKIGQNA